MDIDTLKNIGNTIGAVGTMEAVQHINWNSHITLSLQLLIAIVGVANAYFINKNKKNEEHD